MVKRLVRSVHNHVPDGVFIAGSGLTSYGFWMAWPPLGFIVGGLAVIFLAFAIESTRK